MIEDYFMSPSGGESDNLDVSELDDDDPPTESGECSTYKGGQETGFNTIINHR